MPTTPLRTLSKKVSECPELACMFAEDEKEVLHKAAYLGVDLDSEGRLIIRGSEDNRMRLELEYSYESH